VTATYREHPPRLDRRLHLPTADDDANDFVGELSFRCEEVCSLPGAAVAVVACPG
jgi:hypothetical protein